MGSCYNHEIKKIEIMYVNFTIETIFHINCSDFEVHFKDDIKKVSVNRTSYIERFMKELDNLVEEKNYTLEPDARMKIKLVYKNKEVDICMDHLGLMKDGKIYKFTDSFKSILNEMVKENLWE